MAVSPAPATAGQLRIHLLGGLRLQVGDLTLPGDWRLRKSAHLVAMLALAPDYRLHREHLLDALWPDLEPVAASNNLAQAVLVARRAIDPAAGAARSCFKREGGTLALRPPGGLWVDVEAFVASAVAARQSQEPRLYWQATDLYGGDLLPEEPYVDWAASRREALRQTYLEVLLALGRLHQQRGEHDHALTALQRLIASEPAHEAAHRLAMSAYRMLGQTDQAMRQYDTLREALAIDLDAEPDADSQRLYEQLLIDRQHVQEAVDSDSLVAALKPASSAHLLASMTNLPHPLTSFVGREREVAEVTRLLSDSRLLTMTGPGGVGKTRLASEVARTMASDYPDGVWLIELAALADPALVPQAVARALKVDEKPDQSTTETLIARLANKRLLLVLDNCEHLLDACAALAETVLQACPGVRALITSREALRLTGELVWRVPSLGLPEHSDDTSANRTNAPDVFEADAIRLFAERARFIQPSFTVTAGNAATVARVCARLDGIPLALELAAARLNALSIEELDERLGDAYRLLTGGSRSALPRQQTLRATLEWSHDLLTEPERVLFRRLGVFTGGWSLDAAEAVCAGPDIGASDVLDLITQLVGKSLAQADTSGGATRYRLLETVRQYAWERLDAADESTSVRDQHAAWCLALAERADPELRSHDQLRWLARLDSEHDNCRAALNWLLERDPSAGLRLAGALGWYWWVRAFLSEGRQWLDAFLARAPERTEARVWALHGAGRLARHLGDWYAPRRYWEAALELGRDLESGYNVAWIVRDLGLTMHDTGHVAVGRSLLEEGLVLARQVGDRRGEGVALDFLGRVLLQSTIERGRGQALLEESLAVLRQVGDRWALSGLLDSLAVMNWSLGDYARAGAQAAEGLSIAIEIGAPIRIALFQSMLGQLAYVTGDGATALRHFDLAMPREQLEVSWVAVTLSRTALVACQVGETARAEALARESMALLDAQHGPGAWAWPSYVLGRVALRRADFVAATDLLREALRQWRALTDDVGIAPTLEPLAQAALGQGHLVRAARLLGAADALRRQLDAPLPPVERPDHVATLAAVRAALDASVFQEAFDDGAKLTLDLAVAEALDSLSPSEPRHEELTTRR